MCSYKFDLAIIKAYTPFGTIKHLSFKKKSLGLDKCNKKTSANKVLPKAGLTNFVRHLCKAQDSIRLNFCAKNLRLRQAPKRYLLLLQNDTTNTDK